PMPPRFSYALPILPLSSHTSPILPSFFFLMIRRPPRSTLFPTRRSSDLQTPMHPVDQRKKALDCQTAQPWDWDRQAAQSGSPRRSEEHTSELQSLTNLVCRLLLEKKKKTKTNNRHELK